MLITWLIRKTVTQSQNSEKPSKTMLGILFVTYFCYVGIQFVPNPLIFLKECKKECFPKNSKLVQVTKNKWQLTSSCVIFDICHIVFLTDFVSFKSPVKHKTLKHLMHVPNLSHPVFARTKNIYTLFPIFGKIFGLEDTVCVTINH